MSTPHCESCGSTDGQDLHDGDQGYTACCNELICYGSPQSQYGTTTNHVTACCWSQATAKFGGPDKIPDGSSRLTAWSY